MKHTPFAKHSLANASWATVFAYWCKCWQVVSVADASATRVTPALQKHSSNREASAEQLPQKCLGQGMRACMYFGQLPKLCSTSAVSVLPARPRTTALTRLRRRVPRSMPRKPRRWPGVNSAAHATSGVKRM